MSSTNCTAPQLCSNNTRKKIEIRYRIHVLETKAHTSGYTSTLRIDLVAAARCRGELPRLQRKHTLHRATSSQRTYISYLRFGKHVCVQVFGQVVASSCIKNTYNTVVKAVSIMPCIFTLYETKPV